MFNEVALLIARMFGCVRYKSPERYSVTLTTRLIIATSFVVVGVATASCSSTADRSAAGVSADPTSSSTAAVQALRSEATAKASTNLTPPETPRSSWKLQGHQLTLQLRSVSNSSPVEWFEATVAERDKFPDPANGIQKCQLSETGDQTAVCPLAPLKRGNWDIFVRAVNAAGSSDWLQGASASVDSCTTGDVKNGACQVFDKGPGGGRIVYDAGSRQSWGQYLEVAPAGWSGSAKDPEVEWCKKNANGYAKRLDTSDAIGSGAANTALIIKDCGSSVAAGQAAAYRGGGFDDWFLPSRDEGVLAYNMRSEVGGLNGGIGYWSSSQEQVWKAEIDDEYLFATVIENPSNAMQPITERVSKHKWKSVRPMRAF